MSPECAIALDHFAAATGGRPLRTTLNDLVERCLIKGNIRRTMEATGYTQEQIKTYLGLRLQPYEENDESEEGTTADGAEATPKAPKAAKAPKAVKPPKAAKAPKAAAAPADSESAEGENSAPVSVTIDGVTAPAKGWRGVYIPLVEAVNTAGKLDQVKSTFLSDAPHPERPAGSKQLSFGKYLDVGLSGKGLLVRSKKMVEILGVPVSFTTADGNTVTL